MWGAKSRLAERGRMSASPLALRLVLAAASLSLGADAAAAAPHAISKAAQQITVVCPPLPALHELKAYIEMNPQEMGEWLERSATFSRLAPTFRKEQIDVAALVVLSPQDLMAAGIPLGAAAKLKICAEELLVTAESFAPGASVVPATRLSARRDEPEEPEQRGHRQMQEDVDSAVCEADVDSNGAVGTTDLLQVLSAFGRRCSASGGPPTGEASDGGLCACSGELEEMVSTVLTLR